VILVSETVSLHDSVSPLARLCHSTAYAPERGCDREWIRRFTGLQDQILIASIR
jgi:hypothetical protein